MGDHGGQGRPEDGHGKGRKRMDQMGQSVREEPGEGNQEIERSISKGAMAGKRWNMLDFLHSAVFISDSLYHHDGSST